MLNLALLIGCLLPAQVDRPADAGLELQVRRLVRQLDAPRRAEREEAEQKLLEMGPAILDPLPHTDDAGLSEETRNRVMRIRQKLQHLAGAAAARASSITLHAQGMPLSKVLAALAAQSGNKIVDYRAQFGHQATDPELTVDFEGTPFWQALDAVLDQAEMTVYPYGEEGAISIVARAPGRLPRSAAASYSGPFRLEPVRVLAQRDLRNEEGQSLSLAVEAAWEPRLRPIALKQKMADLSAVDEQGNSLMLGEAGAEMEIATTGGTAEEVIVPLKLPPRSTQEIAKLRGRLTTILPGPIETFTFDDLTQADDVEKRVADVTVTLRTVRRNNDLWQVSVLVRFDQPGKALESHRGWIDANEAYLEDAAGKRVDYLVTETVQQSDDTVGVVYGFDLEGPPTGYKFVYKTPARIMAASFVYEIDHVKLP